MDETDGIVDIVDQLKQLLEEANRTHGFPATMIALVWIAGRLVKGTKSEEIWARQFAEMLAL